MEKLSDYDIALLLDYSSKNTVPDKVSSAIRKACRIIKTIQDKNND